MKPMTFEQRFMRHIKKSENGCWIWEGAKLSNGYGKCRDMNMKSSLAHRASYEYFVGELEPLKYVCHKCDTPSCVNPAHLFLGTPLENQQDSKKKGRAIKASFKLNKNLVEKIREKLKSGELYQCDIAKEFSISQSMVSIINTKKGWNHV